MSQSVATAIFKKLTNLEQQVQHLKVQAYFNVPKRQQIVSLYSQETVNKALKNTRNRIWQEKYAKKIKGLS
jgi:hypothetical protein